MQPSHTHTLVGRFRWPATRRRQVATVLAIVAIFLATAIASSRLLRIVFEDLDVVAYLGLFVACWVGAGGALVPVPGVRPVSWLMIVQQGAALDPWTVAFVAASAMALGQTSYFLATQRALRLRARSRASASVPAPDEVSEAPGPMDGVEGDAAGAIDEADGDGLQVDPAVDGGGGSAGRVTRLRARVEDQVRRHAILTAFLVALVPSPVTTVATTASAAIGTGYHRWILPTLSGYLVFSVVLALVGQGLFTAIRSLFR